MPRTRSRRSQQDFVNLHSNHDDGECKIKGSQKSKTRSKRSSKRIASRKRGEQNRDKLDSDIFELCLEDIWGCIPEDEKNDYAFFDSLWFNMYTIGNDKSNILKWIKSKKIFSRRYVFVPIVGWGHWSLLILCNLGETEYLGTDKGPRMLLLDSLKSADPTRIQKYIYRFVYDILKSEEQEELEQFRKKVKLEFPEVPQQSGDDCGIYVLYFIYCFIANPNLGEDLSKLNALFYPEELEDLEVIRKDIHSFLEKWDAKPGENN